MLPAFFRSAEPLAAPTREKNPIVRLQLVLVGITPRNPINVGVLMGKKTFIVSAILCSLVVDGGKNKKS